MKKALVTMAVGKRYELMFNQHCKPLWSEYAKKYDFDLIVFTQPLDTSLRAQSRSPAWQKCLILSEPNIQNYDQIVWIDSDVLINPSSPDITVDVPLEKVGAADEYATPTREDYLSYIKRTHEYCVRNNIPYNESLTPTDFHCKYGLKGEFTSVVQTGVMVLSPHYHKDVLEYVYFNYEDKGTPQMNYEMRPLSYEIITQNLEFWISPKFNMLWPFMKTFVYPFADKRPLEFKERNRFERATRKLGINLNRALLTKCVTTAFINNYFLHFCCGTTDDMKYLNSSISSIHDF